MRKSIIGGLLAVGLLAGCGGPIDAEEPSQLTTSEGALQYCEGAFTVTYYSDATYTTVVGNGDCSCGNTLRIFGKQTSYAIESPILGSCN